MSSGGVIDLGQGYHIPADPDTLKYEVEVFRHTLIAIYALLAWEHIVTAHEEIYRWKQLFRGEFVPINIFLLVGRYCVEGTAITSAILFFGQPTSCQGVYTSIYVLYAIAWTALACIFTLRIKAICRDDRRYWWTMAILTFLGSGLWIASIPGFKAENLPAEMRFRYYPICMPVPSPQWRAMGWAAGSIYDIILVLITVYHVVFEMPGHFNRSLKRFLFDTSIMYFAISLSCNVVCLFVELCNKDIIFQALPVPIALAFNMIVGARIVFHSELWSEGKNALLVIDPRRRAGRHLPPRSFMGLGGSAMYNHDSPSGTYDDQGHRVDDEPPFANLAWVRKNTFTFGKEGAAKRDAYGAPMRGKHAHGDNKSARSRPSCNDPDVPLARLQPAYVTPSTASERAASIGSTYSPEDESLPSRPAGDQKLMEILTEVRVARETRDNSAEGRSDRRADRTFLPDM